MDYPEYYEYPDYPEYPEYPEYPARSTPPGMGPGKFLLIFIVIVILLLALIWFAGPYVLGLFQQWQIEKVTTDYGIPILNAVDLLHYKDCNPPPGANMSFFWYNFQITSWDANTNSGTIQVDTYEDLGMQEGTVAFTASFVVNSASSITLSNFNYTTIVGSVLSRMDSGPWTITLTGGTGNFEDPGNTLSLSGRAYADTGASITLVKRC